MRLLLYLAFALLLAGETGFAHQDRILTLQKDGSLTGLPSRFGPASLEVEFRPESDPARHPIREVTLRLGENTTRLPQGLIGLLDSRNSEMILVTSSWYHEEDTLPYYLVVRFHSAGYDKNRWANAGYSLMFNLRTGKLMKMEFMLVGDEGRSLRHLPLGLSALCTPSELAAISTEADRKVFRRREPVPGS